MIRVLPFALTALLCTSAYADTDRSKTKAPLMTPAPDVPFAAPADPGAPEPGHESKNWAAGQEKREKRRQERAERRDKQPDAKAAGKSSSKKKQPKARRPKASPYD